MTTGKQSAENVAGYKKFKADHPCLKEHDASMYCVNTASRKRDCAHLFASYRECMKKWRKKKFEDALAEN